MTARPVLYILPGLLCDENVFADQRRDLADLFEVRSPHFRGFDSMETMAAHVLKDAPERFMLAGFSMGGRVAMQIMSVAAPRVQKLCLFDTGATPEPPDGWEKRKPLVDMAYEQGMEAVARVWLPPMLAPGRANDEDFKHPLIEMICKTSPLEHEKQIRALVNRPDYGPLLAKIACPTLVLCGAQDAWSTPDQHRALAAAIPGAQLKIIEGAGHFVSVEQPAAFTSALRAFFSEEEQV